MADYFTGDHFRLLNKWKGQKKDSSNPRISGSGLHNCINSFLTSPLSTREKLLLESRIRGIENG